ncbi:MAG: hypothetical protein KDI90_05650 [Alphaproteobacteria bacterium]|nr:hypothetical protein [Alphaproteobacteria bacterium]MCB9974914.1 hypothetical protein [Rhodospirillales bacterium]
MLKKKQYLALALLFPLLLFPKKIFAEEAKPAKKIIKTSFFTIELSERFINLEGGKNILSGYIEGRFFANTYDYFPMANKVTPDGSALVIEYSASKKLNASDEKRFIEETLKFYNEDIVKENNKSKNQTRIIVKPTILEQNKNFTTLHMSKSFTENKNKTHMNMFIYTFLLKRLNTSVHYFYIDSNDEETGSKAAQNIYEQIKKTSLQIISEKKEVRLNP